MLSVRMQQSQATEEIACCAPTGCDAVEHSIGPDDVHAAVRVICNNEQCTLSQFMHRCCFEAWENSVLTYLRSTGRARSWSEKQRLQNLWTKKGYDLAFKACGCKCGRGHLRKDLNWIPPQAKDSMAEKAKRRNRKKRANDKPTLALPMAANSAPGSIGLAAAGTTNGANIAALRRRSNSMSSTGSSPAGSSLSDSPNSPAHFGNGFGACSLKRRFFSDRHGTGSIFSRRLDFSSFNSLPRHKINSYHIKMEDDGNHGNDETRCFVLSNLATLRLSRASCLLCRSSMMVFDQYPLIDGTFFVSPRRYAENCIPVNVDERQQFLCAVCMSCLEGWTALLRCRFCRTRWDGSSLVLGTMYSYDIFAANPCCPERLTCTGCRNLVLHPEHRFNFYSDYSHSMSCPHCAKHDYHFVKPLSFFAGDDHNLSYGLGD
jgi:hypothetical protein